MKLLLNLFCLFWLYRQSLGAVGNNLPPYYMNPIQIKYWIYISDWFKNSSKNVSSYKSPLYIGSSNEKIFIYYIYHT